MTAPRTVRRAASAEGGQASVEFVALIPIMVTIAAVVVALLAGHAAREAADQGAVAAAVAALQGTDPEDAAREAAPKWSRVRVRVRDGAATVEVRPRVPRVVARAVDARRTVRFEPGRRP